MDSRNNILSTIGRPNNQAKVVVNMHNTNDIIRQMERAHYDNSNFAKKIAKQYKGDTIKETCQNIFNWIKDNIQYKIEPAHLQTTKSLQRLVSDGYGDCKHYSGFFAAILTALNIKHHYRFASYTRSKTPTHVYVVAYDEKNRPIICDAVLERFNTEKNYNNKIDKYMLAHLSGIDSIGAKGKVKAKVKAVAKKVVQAPKQAVKAVAKGTTTAAKKVATAAKKIPAGAKKVSIAPGRAAFLGLVALNFRGFATKLAASNQATLKSKWNNLGGDFGKLQQAINSGKSKKALLAGIDNEDNIGSVAATAVAAAAPVIIALNAFLKESGEAINKAKTLFKNTTGQSVEQTPFEQDKDLLAPATPVEGEQGNGSGISPVLLIGGAALAFFALKGK